MATSQISRTIRLFVDKNTSQAAATKLLADEARAKRDELIRSGQASPTYLTLVDGVDGRSEDVARRVIQYQFSRIEHAVSYALGYAKARSPVDSGEYQKAWLVLINGHQWGGIEDPIPVGATVTIVNPVPYARKVEVGAMRMSVSPGVAEDTRRAVQQAYPNVQVEFDYVFLPSGLDPRAPYVLKGRTKSRRKDRQRGQSLLYPAVIITSR